MVRYLTLLNFTDAGVREVKETVRRAADFRSAAEKAGGKVLSQYWAIGEADGAMIFEAPDEAVAARLLLGLAQHGFVRTHSMRIFDAQEFQKVLASA